MSPVVPHDPRWAARYAEAATRVAAALAPLPITLHHIGSTAVPNIMAKPIIDMLGVVEALAPIDAATPLLRAIGFEAMGEYGIPGRRYFRLDAGGVRSHHLHIFAAGASPIARHLAFRDYLIAHPHVAAAYSALKAGLPAAGYQAAKDPFIAATLATAVAWAQRQASGPV
jgi:GrpB-like predicted nucleotidyltransferase (UPF0157 family)